MYAGGPRIRKMLRRRMSRPGYRRGLVRSWFQVVAPVRNGHDQGSAKDHSDELPDGSVPTPQADEAKDQEAEEADGYEGATQNNPYDVVAYVWMQGLHAVVNGPTIKDNQQDCQRGAIRRFTFRLANSQVASIAPRDRGRPAFLPDDRPADKLNDSDDDGVTRRRMRSAVSQTALAETGRRDERAGAWPAWTTPKSCAAPPSAPDNK
jgi:hypothetical protein